MTNIEAIAWLNGEKSSLNYMQDHPVETWEIRIAQCDAAMIQQAYWINRYHTEKEDK